MAEIVWIIEPGAEEDIASDLSVFHRIDDPGTISFPRYLSLAVRLHHYVGAVRARRVLAPGLVPADVAQYGMTGDVAQYGMNAAPVELAGSTLAAMTDGGEFPGIEYTGG